MFLHMHLRFLLLTSNDRRADQREVQVQQPEWRARASPASLRPAEVPMLLSVGLVDLGGVRGGWVAHVGWMVGSAAPRRIDRRIERRGLRGPRSPKAGVIGRAAGAGCSRTKIWRWFRIFNSLEA